MRRTIACVLCCASLCLSMVVGQGCSANNLQGGSSDSTLANAGSTSKNKEFDGKFDATVTAGNAQEVVYVNGSWFDMGRQYGLQQKDQLENNWTAVMTSIYAEADDAAYNEAMDKILKHYEEDDPSVFDFLSGVAEGAGVSKEDAVVAVMGSSVLNYDLMMHYDPERSKTCMNVSAWGDMTQDGHHLGDAGNGPFFIGVFLQYHCPSPGVQQQHGNSVHLKGFGAFQGLRLGMRHGGRQRQQHGHQERHAASPHTENPSRLLMSKRQGGDLFHFQAGLCDGRSHREGHIQVTAHRCGQVRKALPHA